jgi:hypothetical protein
MSSEFYSWTKYDDINDDLFDSSFRLYSDATTSTPTIVNPKTNLRKGDLFVINLNDDGTQKLFMEVDEERAGQSPHPG